MLRLLFGFGLIALSAGQSDADAAWGTFMPFLIVGTVFMAWGALRLIQESNYYD